MNQKLDATLSAFLRLLGAHLLVQEAKLVLEYLIRRFKCARHSASGASAVGAPPGRSRPHAEAMRLSAPTAVAFENCRARRRVHVHNVGAAVAGALHYHSTPEFVRLVQARPPRDPPALSQRSAAQPVVPLLCLACLPPSFVAPLVFVHAPLPSRFSFAPLSRR